MPRLTHPSAERTARVTVVTSCDAFCWQSQKCVVAGLKPLIARGTAISSSQSK